MSESHVNSIKRKRILLSPLNWGWGHVTRTTPIIQGFIKNGNEVIVCCNSEQEEVYRNYFPELWYVPHDGYPFVFKGKGNWSFDIMSKYFSLNNFLKEEIKKVEELVDKFNPDIIISDQRFGFRSDTVRSVVISHQLNLPVSRLNFLVRLLNKNLLNKFDEIWVPDNKTEPISGVLSYSSSAKVHFIGTCSRFRKDAIDKYLPNKKKYKYLGIVSGPQPYSESFLKLLTEKFSNLNHRCAIISPVDCSKFKKMENLDFFYRPKHDEFLTTLLKSDTVVSRSGYSTLMDLIETGNKAILIPTKGQKEQVYLASHLKARESWHFCSEKEFVLMNL